MSVDYSKNTELLERLHNGDNKAKDELLELNMGLVRNIALKFKDRAAETHGCELDDLIQLGAIGMIKAMNSYDSAYGTAFSTYAVPLIIGEIKRFLRDDGPIKVSRTTKRLGALVLHTSESFKKQYGREPSIDELAKILDTDREELCNALLSMKQPHSFSEPVNEDGAELGELIAGDDDRIEGICDKLSLKQALDTMPELWQKIVALRYFRDLSQQKTAEVLGLTQVKISREEKKIFAHLRAVLK